MTTGKAPRKWAPGRRVKIRVNNTDTKILSFEYSAGAVQEIASDAPRHARAVVALKNAHRLIGQALKEIETARRADLKGEDE